MRCGRGHDHETVAEVLVCYGLPPVGAPVPDAPRVNGPTDNQWNFYKDLCYQLGKRTPTDTDRDIFTFDSIKPQIDFLKSERDSRKKQVKAVANDSASVPAGRTPNSAVPAGRYAIKSATGNNDLDFYKVDRPDVGRWAGYVFVKLLVGGDKEFRVRGAKGETVLRRIAAEGIEAAMTRYGQKFGHCGHCGRTLTDDDSRTRGIGPVCYGKMGF